MSELGRQITPQDITKALEVDKTKTYLPEQNKRCLENGLVAELLHRISLHPLTEASEHMADIEQASPELLEGLGERGERLARRCIRVAKTILTEQSQIRLLSVQRQPPTRQKNVHILVSKKEISEAPSLVNYVKLPIPWSGYEEQTDPHDSNMHDLVEKGGLIFNNSPFVLEPVLNLGQFRVFNLLGSIRQDQPWYIPEPNRLSIHEIGEPLRMSHRIAKETINSMNIRLRYIGLEVSQITTGADTNRYLLKKIDE